LAGPTIITTAIAAAGTTRWATFTIVGARTSPRPISTSLRMTSL